MAVLDHACVWSMTVMQLRRKGVIVASAVLFKPQENGIEVVAFNVLFGL